jgi:choline dehydrogenase-like flavoprotein
MIWTRGNKRDYDSWSEAGNSGWSYDEVLPYFKKIEAYHAKDFQNNGFHESSGAVYVEDVPYRLVLKKIHSDSCLLCSAEQK